LSERRRIDAVTLDFFDTLASHRTGRGRGRQLTEYLQERGYEPAPWQHDVLYRVFERHAIDYSPDSPEPERRRYLDRLAGRAFRELGMEVSEHEASRHADPLWRILGPAAFEVFPEVVRTLDTLSASGVRLAVVSNWPCGLAHFLSELGLARYFEHVVGSGDCGFEKPDPRIFDRASALLGVPTSRILHVGDTFEADYVGGRAAGCRVALLARRPGARQDATPVIRSLEDLLALPELAGVQSSPP
jgi:HAD superfamily hydrolase (TIGR01549 family)